MHALLLAFAQPQSTPAPGALTALVQPPLTVRLVEQPAAKSEAAPPADPTPLPRPAPPTPPARPRATAPRPPRPIDEARKPEPAPEPPPAEPTPAPPQDMAAHIEARRKQRESAMGKGAEASQQDADKSSLARNLATLTRPNEGTGGVFQILTKGHRSATFAFNGWQPNRQRGWREVIEVEAGPGESIELAIVRRMIRLIRGHYKGDFRWESYRLDLVVTLSARPEDTAGLEDFMMREFFDAPRPGR